MRQQRLKPDARKENILAVALPLAAEYGYTKITRDQVAAAAGVSGPVLNYHFGSMVTFRWQLMRYAVQKECLPVVAQGVVAGDERTLEASPDLRRKALASLF